MRVGDLVNNEKRNRLYCGSGFYPHAVVMQLNPLIMVSEQTDMLWTCVTPDEVPVVLGHASLLTQIHCLRRLTKSEIWTWLTRWFR